MATGYLRHDLISAVDENSVGLVECFRQQHDCWAPGQVGSWPLSRGGLGSGSLSLSLSLTVWSVCLSVFLCLSPSLSVSLCFSPSLSLSLSLCFSPSVRLSVCLSLSNGLSVGLCLSLSDSVSVSLRLSVYLSVCLSLSVSVCLSISLSCPHFPLRLVGMATGLSLCDRRLCPCCDFEEPGVITKDRCGSWLARWEGG